MPSPIEPRAAWQRFCDELKQAGEVVLGETAPGDELTRAEGLRHLVRMIRAGFESSCEFADGLRPEIVPMVTRTMLYEGVTPDARYMHAFIEGRETYRLRGRRGTASFIELSIYTGQTGLHPNNDMLSSLTEAELQVDADGRFEVVLSPNAHEGNWLATGAEARRLFIRQYAHDWNATQPASFEIECEGTSGHRPPLRLEQVVHGLERTAAFVASAPAFWSGISEYWRGHALNRIVPQQQADSRTDITVPSGHRFACGYFELADDEVLEIEFAPADVPFWSLGLANYWYEPLHWPDTRSSLNDRSAVREADGSVRILLSERAPARGNWLALDGHRQGTLVFRWSRTNEPIPVFETRVRKAPAS